jgi:hypothetical protein
LGSPSILNPSRTSTSEKKRSVYDALRTYSGFDGVPSSQAGPVKLANPPVLYAYRPKAVSKAGLSKSSRIS